MSSSGMRARSGLKAAARGGSAPYRRLSACGRRGGRGRGVGTSDWSWKALDGGAASVWVEDGARMVGGRESREGLGGARAAAAQLVQAHWPAKTRRLAKNNRRRMKTHAPSQSSDRGALSTAAPPVPRPGARALPQGLPTIAGDWTCG